MRKYLLLLALLATSDAFAWSMDARVPSKPVCDRIDTAPAKSVVALPRAESPAPVVSTTATVSASTTVDTPVPTKNGGSTGIGRGRAAPRWQSFLPGMYK